MPRIGNPDGLPSAAEQKQNDALERTDKAISQMVKQGKKINFHTEYPLPTFTNMIQLNSALTS